MDCDHHLSNAAHSAICDAFSCTACVVNRTREHFFLQIWVMCGKSLSKIIERSILCRDSIDFRSKDWAGYSTRWIVFCWRKPSMIRALYYFALPSCRVKLSALTLLVSEYVLLNNYRNQWFTEGFAFDHPNTSVFLWSASKYWIALLHNSSSKWYLKSHCSKLDISYSLSYYYNETYNAVLKHYLFCAKCRWGIPVTERFFFFFF